MMSSSLSSSPLIRKKKVMPISDYNTSGTENEISSLPSAKKSDAPNFSVSAISTASKRSRHLTDFDNVQQLELSPVIGFPRTSTPTDANQYLEPKIHIIQHGALSPSSLEKRRARSQEQAVPKVKKKNITISTASFAKKLSDYESSPSTKTSKSIRKNLTIDTSSLAKKIKFWFDKQESPKSLEIDSFDTLLGIDENIAQENNNLSPVLNKRRTSDTNIYFGIERKPELSASKIVEKDIDILRGEEHNMSKTLSYKELWHDDTQGSTKSPSFHSFTSDSIDTVINDRKSISSMSLRLSSMRSDDRETSLDSFFEASQQSAASSCGYISSTTSLWDLVANMDLDYTIPTPSDSTGNEDYHIVFERRYQKEIERKQQMKYEEKLKQMKEQEIRRRNFQQFFIEGITWSKFSCDYISFSLKPKDIYPGHFSSKKKYTFSMYYTGRHWNIKTWRIPDRAPILKMYSKAVITDRNIKQFFEFVVSLIHRDIELERDFKEERAADYFNGEDVDLNESDLELLLSEEEKKEYKERCQKLWQGMMTPPK